MHIADRNNVKQFVAADKTVDQIPIDIKYMMAQAVQAAEYHGFPVRIPVGVGADIVHRVQRKQLAVLLFFVQRQGLHGMEMERLTEHRRQAQHRAGLADRKIVAQEMQCVQKQRTFPIIQLFQSFNRSDCRILMVFV